MSSSHNLRKVSRENLDGPQLALLYFLNEKLNTFHFITVLNFGVQGVLIESNIYLDKESKLKILIKNSALNQWDFFFCRVAWI